MGNSRVLQKATKELTKAKAPKTSKDIIYDPAGQWKFPGQDTRIPGGNITMQGVPYPVLAQPNVGQPQMMYPGQDYVFPGADYVDEQPQMKKGGRPRGLISMPKPSKKGLASKAYSRSLDATNRLFTENNLFKKPKDKRRKVFDPNAKYYADGGEYGMPLGTGVSQNFIGNRDEFKVGGIPELPLRDNRVNYNAFVNGFEPMTKKQGGGKTDAMTGMMKARLAYANEFGNPAAKRMINLPDNPYQFDDGDTGTHYMASMDNYAVPQIQDENGQLMLGDYGPESNEAMRFDTDEDADYFAEHYKDVSPGFIEAELTDDEIQAYRDGGYIVEDISIPSLNQMQDGGENDFYKVKGSKGVYRKVNGKWEVDWDKTGNFQPLSKGDVKKRSEQLNKNAEPLLDPDYNTLTRKENFKYTEAPKTESKKKLTESESKAQDILAKDFNVSGTDKIGKVEGKVEKDIANYIKWHKEFYGKEPSQDKIDRSRENFSNIEFAGAGVYNPVWGEFKGEPIPTVSNKDSEYIMKTDFPEDATAGDYVKRGWEYITNPFTAAEYSISGGGAENMPFNINELRMKGVDPGVVEGRNIVGDAVNATTNLFDAGDKVVRNVGEGNYGTAALEALRFLPVAGYVDDIAKFTGKATKIPKQLPGSPNQEELVDLWRIQERGARPMAELAAEGKLGKMGTYPAGIKHFKDREKYFGQWFTKDKSDFDFYKADREFKDPEIINLKVPKNKLEEFQNYDKSLSRAPDREFVVPHEQQGLYKVSETPKELPGSSNKSFMSKVKDYFDRPPGPLMLGLGSVAKPTKEVPLFKSEIDWVDWVKKYNKNYDAEDIQNIIRNSEEYNIIEQQTKANDTWMKNVDGTPFQGTPEQFIQSQSTKFKQAYPEGTEITYRGGDKRDALKSDWDSKSNVVFTTKDEFGARTYNRTLDQPPLVLTEAPPEGISQLYMPKTSNKIVIDGNEYPVGHQKRNYGYHRNYARLNAIDQLPANELEAKNLEAFKTWMLENHPTMTERGFSGEPRILNDWVMTDHFADFLNSPAGKDISRVEFQKIIDGTLQPIDVEVHNLNKAQQLKSMWGNSGEFDLTNPNKFKALLPYLIPTGLGVGAASQRQGQESNEEYKKGGVVSNLTKKEIDKLVAQGYIVEDID